MNNFVIDKPKKVLVIGLSGKSIFLTVDHFNKSQETIYATSILNEPGGKGFNQAIQLGLLQSNVSFITFVGEDYYDVCKTTLEQCNVKPIIIEKKEETSIAVIITDKDGDNKVCCYPGISSNISFFDLNIEILKESEIVLIQNEYPLSFTSSLINYLYELNKVIVFNPAPYKDIDLDILKKVTYLIPNEQEYECLINEYNDKLDDIKTIVTRGNKNVLYKYKGQIKEFHVPKVNAIDTTGAGDSFCAALVSYIANFKDLNDDVLFEAIEFAINVSSLKVLKRGIVKAMPKLSEVLK